MASTERTMQGTIKTSIEALSYISANSIPVRNFDENNAGQTMPFVLVRCSPRERIAPNYNYYRIPAQITICHHRDDEANIAVSDNVFDAVADWLVPATIKTLLSADGIVPGPGTEEVEEAFHFRGVSFDIYETL